MLEPQNQILLAFLCCASVNGKMADEVPIANTRKIPINSGSKQVRLFTIFSIIMVTNIVIIIIMQFNSCLFTRKLNSLKANYKVSTNTQKETEITKTKTKYRIRQFI
jgi:hypothetical protein